MTFQVKKKVLERDLIRLLIVVAAAFIMALNIKSFVRAGNLFPGGFTGLSLLIQRGIAKFTGVMIPYAPINLLLNIGPIILSFKTLGRKFTVYSCLMIVLSSIFTDLLPARAITYQLPLIGIFGGLINGAVISMCLMANATSGGTDFIAVFLSEKKGIDAWNYILVGNAIVLIAAGYLFGWDAALYSIIFQFTSTEVVHRLYRHYRRDTLFVITEHPTQVYEVIKETTRHDATVFKGIGCYEQEERNMIYSVIGGDEVGKVKKKIKEVDERAFINVIRTEQLTGRFYSRPNE